MAQSFFKLDKSWYDGELWVMPGEYQREYQSMAFADSELFKIYDGGDFIIAAIRNYHFYLKGLNPVFFSGFLHTQV